MRTVLNYCVALLVAVLGAKGGAQETPGKRLAGVIAVAMDEYHQGVDAQGRVISQTELYETRGFFVNARDVASRVTGPNAAAVRALVDSMARATGAAQSTTVVDALYGRLVAALGADAALDNTPATLDLAAGKASFERNCVSCHGAAGFGDGPASKGMEPPPAALAGPGARDMKLGLMYRVVSVGVTGTQMPAWAEKLAPEERWNVVAYANSLRGAATGVAIASANQRMVRDLQANVTQALDSAMAALATARAADATDRAFDAYAFFEPVEAAVNAHDPQLRAKLEAFFMDFRTAVQRGDNAAAKDARDSIEVALPRAAAVASTISEGWTVFGQSVIIIVREGFEVILILGAIVAMLMRTGNAARAKEVRLGALLALVASGITAVILKTVLSSLPASGEVVEGATLLVAVVVLFSVSYWILSKVESDRWQAFIRDKVSAAVRGGGRATLVGVAFLVVYREGAETVLFYQALLLEGSGTVPYVLSGLATGSIVLAAIYYLFHRFGVRMPLRPFFAATGALLYLMAFVFIGQGLRELQEGGAIAATRVVGAPYLDALGIYPTVQTIAGQAVLLGLFVVALLHTFVTPRIMRKSSSRKSPDGRGRGSGGHTSR